MHWPTFPTNVDSSMVSTYRACSRKFELEYLQHWKPKTQSVHLVAGAAYARGLEVTRIEYFQNGKPAEEAIGLGAIALTKEYGDFDPPARGSGAAKTLPNMLAAHQEYFLHHGLETDSIKPLMVEGKPAVEFSFALPLDVTHPDTGDPILYTGRFDMLGIYNDQLFAVDEKTTTQLGPSWFKQWKLRSQFTGYCWAAREYNYPVAGAIVRGVAIKAKSFDHAESIQYRDEWFIERWYKQVCRDVERMKTQFEEGYFDYDLDGACSHYGGCMFQEICSSRHPNRWLNQNFSRRIWDPISGTEKPMPYADDAHAES